METRPIGKVSTAGENGNRNKQLTQMKENGGKWKLKENELENLFPF